MLRSLSGPTFSATQPPRRSGTEVMVMVGRGNQKQVKGETIKKKTNREKWTKTEGRRENKKSEGQMDRNGQKQEKGEKTKQRNRQK